MDRLAVVVPCYNEEEVLPICMAGLRQILGELINEKKISPDSFMLFVNDGSKDRTWEILAKEQSVSNDVCAIKLARNVGHQSALLAGLSVAKDRADIIISIDADLQDDVNVMRDMVDAFHRGKDIVYGVRSGRKTDTFFKRATAQGYYKIMHMMGVETVYNHADYRLMSKRAVEELFRYDERNIYLRGMVPLLGYESEEVYYERHERAAGVSKYPLKKMMGLALDGITSFSTKPIAMITALGFLVLICCFGAAVYAFVSYFFGYVERGWTSLILSIWFLGGVQLLSIGIVGEYIGKIYKEVKHRPLYNIEICLEPGTDNIK